MSVALSGKDTLLLDTRILQDLADGDTAVLEFPNDSVSMKKGKNGNALYAFNSTGKTVNVTIRVVAGSADDKYLNSRYQEFLLDPPSFIFLEGEFVKRVGDGQGNITNIVYKMDGGVIMKPPGSKENVEVDTEQSVSIYTIGFANNDRALS